MSKRLTARIYMLYTKLTLNVTLLCLATRTLNCSSFSPLSYSRTVDLISQPFCISTVYMCRYTVSMPCLTRTALLKDLGNIEYFCAG